VSRAIVARLLRLIVVAGWTAGIFAVVVIAVDRASGPPAVLLPFLAAVLAAAVIVWAREPLDRFVGGLTGHRFTTPYAVLAETTARVNAGSLDQALPGLAQVLAEGTGAQRAAVWLTVEDRLVEAVTYPAASPDDGKASAVADNLAVLLARPDTDHVVPVLDGAVLRAALVVEKAGGPVTAADRQLVQEVAEGAGLLLRSVQRGAELRQRVARAEELAVERRESRERLTRAREVERRRLVAELAQATTARLAALHDALRGAQRRLDAEPDRPEPVQERLGEARTALDELLDRLRVIARGVYPAMLRDQGPVTALEEVVADLPRPVRLTGGAATRLGWEVESGTYHLAAAAVTHLGGKAADTELHVHLEHRDGRLTVRIEDPAVDPGAAEALRDALAGDVERLAALGGEAEIAEHATGATVTAWLPERLEPLVDARTGV
jgi:signal transduction histidine kinase